MPFEERDAEMLGNDWRNDLAIRLLESGEEISADDRKRIVGRLLNLIDERQAMVEVVEAARKHRIACNEWYENPRDDATDAELNLQAALDNLDAEDGNG